MIPFKHLPFKVSQVYLTSDTHYGHKNICSGTTSWPKDHAAGCRNFSLLEQMNDEIVNGVNSTVGKNDLLIHCGDWSFGGKDIIQIFRKKVICQNIILLQGNHDHHISQAHVGPRNFFIEFSQIGFYQVETLKFVCAHYPMAIWHQSHHNVPLFYGHVHGSYENVGKSLDVGIDNIFKMKQRYTPIGMQDAYDICQKKAAFLESHHDEFTN